MIKLRGKTLALVVLAVFFILAAPFLYTWIALNWNYSSGERGGYIQKFSRKGWVCKTWEGEMVLMTMPGTISEKFLFTVRSDEVAEKINKAVGQKVSLKYEEHRGLPSSCFGDTEYFVTDLRIMNN